MNPEGKLEEAAKLVVQERRMLLRTYEELKRIDSADDEVNVVEKNVYLESFMLHYRNVLDFLEPRDSEQADDVTAADFLPNHEAYDPPVEYRRPIDRRLAHLSYSRLEVPIGDKPWLATEMLEGIEKTWKAFIDGLDVHQECRSDWFGPQTAEAARGEPFIGVSASGVVSASTSATETAVIYLSPP